MLTKFESKSNRVKGLSFHTSRPWILTALHNGVVQLWDYRMGTLLDKFDEHDGPVRGVDFHKSQPLFVSGGDDYKIKVWDYKLRRCLFTLLGHLDYIRTVQFHVEYPWIITCSDDQTVRIWNWQSRTCISVLTGHNHYVMSASFHPKEDLVVSASLDQTVRVWDTTGLRKKTVRGAPGSIEEPIGHNSRSGSNSDLFGGTDAVVKYVLEGHDRGVNWASFHPTLPLIISGADDRQVKLWRMNETKAWEVDTMRGHTNNVSCVLFHPKHELLVSNSEDRSIRVWDITKRMGVQTFRRENDRFWILAAHPEQNLLAAGHDSGMIVFKLERERPALASVSADQFLYVKERYLRLHQLSNGRDVPVVSLRRTGTIGSGLGNAPRTLVYNAFNPSEHNVLISSDADEGTYELLTFSKDGIGQVESQDLKRGSGLAAVFVARNRYAVLNKNRQIVIKNFQNEITKKIQPPGGQADGIFFTGTVGRLLIKSEDKIILFENQSRRSLNEVHAPKVKYVIWNADYSLVALLSKHSITIADKQLKLECTIGEAVRIKSGAWDCNGVFVYTTLNHIKYCLSNGDIGIIRTLDVPVYATAVVGSTLHAVDREGKVKAISIDLSESSFKLALKKKMFKKVLHMIRNSRLCGQAIISYLTLKGYPEVALHFVDDEKNRFKLAIACGNIDVALSSAYELDDNDCWHQLGVEALRQGNQQVVEMAYQRTKNFERLSLLYLITGNRDKLKKMMKIAEMRNDVMGRFHNALYLGDAQARVAILESVGHLPLALITAKCHGLHDDEERILKTMEKLEVEVPKDIEALCSKSGLLLPPVPIARLEDDSWPLVDVKDVFATSSAEEAVEELQPEPIDAGATLNYGTDGDLGLRIDDKLGDDDIVGGTDAWGDGELDLGEEEFDIPEVPHGDAADSSGRFLGELSRGTPLSAHWVKKSSVAADHVAAGSFESAMQLLNRQVGIVNFALMKPMFMSVYGGSCGMLPSVQNGEPLKSILLKAGPEKLPETAIKMPALKEVLKAAYRAFTAAKFSEMKEGIEYIVRCIPLLSLDDREQVSQAKELLCICREYLIAYHLRSQLAEVPLTSNPQRNVELSAYLTCCRLQPSHQLLTLKIAMTNAFKTNNFIAAASFCRRLLELPEEATEKHAKLRMTARKVLKKSEQDARNEHEIEYSEGTPFVLDCRSLTPIYAGQDKVHCPYCEASYGPSQKGQLCVVCQLSTVGEKTIGLVVSANR